MYDFHVHSSISADSNSDLIDMAKAGKEKGLKGLCFTQHLDPFFPDEFYDFSIDWEKYKQEFCYAKDMLKDMELFYGLEAGLHEKAYDRLNTEINNNDLDFVLGSIHCTKTAIIGEGDYYQGNKKDLQLEYLLEIVNNIKKFSNFDVVSHIGFVSKFAPEPGWEIHYDDFSDIVDDILKFVISTGKGIEVNTSSLKNSKFTLPTVSVLKRYYSLGGKILTIGSDAHFPQYMAYDFLNTKELLKSIGFTHLAKYTKRQPSFYKI